MVFYALIGNAFSFVLFAVFLLVNGAAGIAWIKASLQSEIDNLEERK
jgi:hypothetical protein